MRRSKVLEYTKYRENYDFKFKELEISNDCIYVDGCLVEDAEKKYAEGDTFLNIGYKLKNSSSSVLSNLYPISFIFKGKRVNSIEGVLQSLKYDDKNLQNVILKYHGMDAYNTRGANSSDFWGEKGLLYWQGKPMKRDSQEYQVFLDELYLSVSKNPLYRKCLLATGDKYLLHHFGKDNINETVLTRFEFEQRINSLREYLKEND